MAFIVQQNYNADENGKLLVEALCNSNDTKPADYADQSLCVETDTGKVFVLHKKVWDEFGEG